MATKKKTFVVTRTFPPRTETLEIEARDEHEAIELAQEADEYEWEEDQFQGYYDIEYFAELS